MEETDCPVESCNQRIGGSMEQLLDSNRFIKCDQLNDEEFWIFISENTNKILKN